MKISRQIGTTSEILSVFLRDATNVSSKGLANIVASSVSYGICRNDQALVSSGACSTSTGALGLYFASTLTQLSSTLALGWYQFGVPDFVFASGTSAVLHMYGAPNMADTPIEIELTKSNNQVYASTVPVAGVNVSSINGATVQGDGTSGNLWRG